MRAPSLFSYSDSILLPFTDEAFNVMERVGNFSFVNSVHRKGGCLGVFFTRLVSIVLVLMQKLSIVLVLMQNTFILSLQTCSLSLSILLCGPRHPPIWTSPVDSLAFWIYVEFGQQGVWGEARKKGGE